MIVFRFICFSVTYLCIKANVSLKFIQRQEKYQDIAIECENEGGVLLMKDEQAFDKVTEVADIPVSQEFWVGDLLYSDWILPIDCAQRSAINGGPHNPKNTSELKKCYTHCLQHPFFAIKKNYCICLDSYTIADTQDLSPCNAACNDFGLCGTYNSSPTQYLSVYETHTGVDYTTRIESPSAMGDSYMECIAAHCPLNDYLGVLCNAGLQKKGLCDTTEVTAGQESYISGLISCAKETGTYYSGVCHNTTKQYVWIGPLRFTFSAPDGMISHLQVAKGSKCTKYNTGSTYTVNCIPTTENTELPFVCKLGSNQQQTTPSEGQTTGNGGSTTGTAVGIGTVVTVVTVVMVIIVIVVVRRRRTNNSQFVCKSSKEESQDPKSAYAMANGEKYDHVYAETTDVYHPYLEICDNKSTTSTEYHHNLIQTNPGEDFQKGSLGNSNKGFVKDTNNTSGKLEVDSAGYIEPARTPNFGRKLPQVPSEQNRL